MGIRSVDHCMATRSEIEYPVRKLGHARRLSNTLISSADDVVLRLDLGLLHVLILLGFK